MSDPGIPARPTPSAMSLPQVVREVEDFAAAAGWDQPPQLFALVSTAELLAKQPELGDQVDVDSALTPVAQEPLPDEDLADALAGIVWPETVSGCALGGAQFCLDRTVAYMKERKQFGTRLADFQALAFRIADYATGLETARLMLHRAAVALDSREPAATRLAAMAKRLATDTGFDVVNGCLQLHGGYGYLRDHPIERVLRDLRVHQILEGTNEVMRLIVSRDMLGN